MQTFSIFLTVVATIICPLLGFVVTKRTRDGVCLFLGMLLGMGTLVFCWYIGMNDEHLRDQYDKISLRDKTIKELNYSLSEAKQKLREYEQNSYAASNDIAAVFSENIALRSQIADQNNTIKKLQAQNSSIKSSSAVYRESSDTAVRNLQVQLEQERAEKHALELKRDMLSAETTRLRAELEEAMQTKSKMKEVLQ